MDKRETKKMRKLILMLYEVWRKELGILHSQKRKHEDVT